MPTITETKKTSEACARRIRFLRDRAGWSARELAQRAGFTQQQISKVESGTMNIPVETLSRLAKALGCTVRDFFVEDVADEMCDALRFYRSYAAIPREERTSLVSALRQMATSLETLP